jgi:hypothetical protein
MAKVGQSGLLTIAWFSDQIPPEGQGYYHHRRPWPRCLHPAVKEYCNEIGYMKSTRPLCFFEFAGPEPLPESSQAHGPPQARLDSRCCLQKSFKTHLLLAAADIEGSHWTVKYCNLPLGTNYSLLFTPPLVASAYALALTPCSSLG